MSPLSDDGGTMDDDEDSTFHREIILQDNYSDSDSSDAQLYMDKESPDVSHLGSLGPSVDGSGSALPSVGSNVHLSERRVKFADEVDYGSDTPLQYLESTGATRDDVYNIQYFDKSASMSPMEQTNMDLLSLLPSSILGNAVEMSKYLSEYVAGHPELEDQLRHIADTDKRKDFGEQVFPESALTAQFRHIDTTQAAIEAAASLASRYTTPPGALMQLMHDVFVSIPTNAAVTRLGIFYVYNHLLHKFGGSTREGGASFADTGLKRFCIPAISHSSRIHCTNAVHMITCVNVWRQRRIYDGETCDRLESLLSSSGKPSLVEAQMDTTTYTVNSEVGGLKTLSYLFKMPLVDSAYAEAIDGIDEQAIIDPDAPTQEQSVAQAVTKDKYALLDNTSRLSGQELILLHSSALDLAALVEEGEKQLELLQNEIAELEMEINGE
ncbi:hypothetical protein BaOVIS_029390 [Babesia ovis]|uniref:CID domain-containing protein n=1 Tax=Babesia ovis TaxID=5869 RepID=A0A9W5TDF7_BABOV|nr:hypothetical protein BaOVIS_029390 [Babesia ovis]